MAPKKKSSSKASAKKDLKSIEQSLWDTANKLRGSVESSEYKHVVLGLIFLKFASDKFERRRAELIAEGQEKYVDRVEFYAMKNVFYLPEESRWSHVQRHAKQDDIAITVDTALATIEKNNKSLAGALPDNYFSRLVVSAVQSAAHRLDECSSLEAARDTFLPKLLSGELTVPDAEKLAADTL